MIRKLTYDEISADRQKPGEISEAQRMPVYALLDNIRSSYNVGSMFRTSDGAMITKLFLTGYTCVPPQKDIMKTALGATESIPWEYHEDPIELIRKLKSEGIKIVALEQTDAGIPYYDVTKEDFPVCLVVGNEISGVADSVIAECDFAIEIPQFGVKQSLNVAVAFGIALFEMRKAFGR